MRANLQTPIPFDAPRQRLAPLQPALQPLPGLQARPARMHFLPLWMILVAGYSTFGRSFAYLGVPPVFIGELFIVWWIVKSPGNWLKRFVDDCMHFKLLPTMILLNMIWGLFDVFRPIFNGRDPAEAIRTFAFNYYPILLPIGIEIGRRMTLDAFIRFWKGYALYFTAYSLVLLAGADNTGWALPWRGDVNLFNVPAMAGFVSVGTLAIWPYLDGWNWRWLVLALSTLPVFTSPGRGTFLSLLLGLAVVGLWAPRRLLLIAGASVGLILLLGVVSPFVAVQAGRATTIDPWVNVARVRATFDADGAYQMLMRRGYQAEAANMLVANGTAQWREAIWTNAIKSLNTSTLVFAGQGHGASVTELTPDNQELHTPHNFVIYALYYTGGVGLAIFCVMLLALLLACQKIEIPALRALVLANVLIMLLMAAVGNMFETPIAAVPFYLITGIGLGIGKNTEPDRA